VKYPAEGRAQEPHKVQNSKRMACIHLGDFHSCSDSSTATPFAARANRIFRSIYTSARHWRRRCRRRSRSTAPRRALAVTEFAKGRRRQRAWRPPVQRNRHSQKLVGLGSIGQRQQPQCSFLCRLHRASRPAHTRSAHRYRTGQFTRVLPLLLVTVQF